MIKQSLLILAAILISPIAIGCARSRTVTLENQRSVTLDRASAASDDLWEAIQETMRRHGFRPDRVDRQAGVITTLPEGSRHFLEFWRGDVVTFHDLMESSISPVRRWVEVSLIPSDRASEEEMQLSIVVHKERLSSPDRQFNSSGAVYQFFGDSLPSTTGAVRVSAEDDRWLDIGRDPALEHCLLGEILRGAGTGIAISTPDQNNP